LIATQNTNGRLALDFTLDAGTSRTLLRINEQRQPLKVVRAFDLDAGAALVHIHNLSGGVLAGDRLSLDVNVGRGASAQVTSTGATRVYRSHPNAQPAQFSTRLHMCRDALLEYLPDPLIPFAGSRYAQHTHIELEEGAGLFWWETIAPGREARGEVFSYDALQLSFHLQAAGSPIATESSHLDPSARPLSSSARLGPYRYFSSFYICRAGIDGKTWRGLETSLREIAQQLSSPVIVWGLSTLPAHGIVIRALSLNGREIASGLVAFWRVAKQMLYGRDAVIPRKIY
jgi:urease accessory protein